MKAVLRAFQAYVKTGVALMFQYRGEIILWSIWGLVNPAVLYLMMKAAAEGASDGRMAGRDPAQLAAYYFAIMVIGHLTAAWDTYEMSWMIRSGRMSALLLRPILPMWKSLADNLSYKIATMAFVLPMWLLFVWWVRPAFEAHAWQVALGVVAVLLAFILNYVACYLVALISFWATKLDAIGEIYFGLVMFMGGRLFPLEALPRLLRVCADVLPFRWMTAFPADLVIGHVVTLREALAGIAAQIGWLAAAILAFRFMWAAALRRHAAVGG